MLKHQVNGRRLWRRFLVVAALCAAGFAAPLLDLYGQSPEVFVANRTSEAQIVIFGLLVTLLPLLLGILLLTLSEWIGPRTASVLYRLVVGVGGLAIGMAISRQLLPESDIGAIGLTLAICAVFVALYKQLEGPLVIFSLALPAVLVLFLGFSPTARLIWEEPATGLMQMENVESPHSVIFVQLDELPTASLMDRDGSINEALFPSFARLGDAGTWYRNAFSASIATTQSVPAAVTGRLGGKDLNPTAIDHPDSLFTLLGASHEMHVIEWVASLCSEDICEDYGGQAPARFVSLLGDVGVVYGHLSLPAWGRDRLPAIDNAWKGFLGQQDDPSPAAVVIEDHPVPEPGERSRWIDWVQRIINGVESGMPPTLHYVHLDSPHVPWQVNPSGSHYVRPEQYTEVDGVEGAGGRWIDDPNITRLAYQRHLYQLGFLDQMLGSLFDRLEATGNWDDAMIIVISDHGLSFVPGEHRRWPYENNRDDLYRVPLFVKYPGQSVGETRDEPAFAIDILPTIVDALGISTDWAFDGISLRTIEGTDRPHEFIRWCCSEEGASTDISVLFEQVERNYGWVPNQTSWTDVAAVGPLGELVGDSAEVLEPEIVSEVRWSLDNTDAFAAIDRSSGMVQTLITGRLEFPSDFEGTDLVIALNGSVAGTGFVSRDSSNGGYFRGLVAEEMLRDGENMVSILLPHEGEWLTGRSADVLLEYVADDGHILEFVEEGNRRLQVDSVTATESGWKLVGWSADVSAKVPPDRMYVFAGETLIAFGPPNIDNPNVVRWFKSDDLLRSGFEFLIDSEAIPEGVDHLTVVAEFGGKAIADFASLLD